MPEAGLKVWIEPEQELFPIDKMPKFYKDKPHQLIWSEKKKYYIWVPIIKDPGLAPDK